ncbi:hypothetical protein ACTACV_10225 [Pseudomonas syringae]|uniref:hypothetical protein n=1 Tax=Pseudomonas syringae TaxID=317 RepID=UPI003F756953
MSATLVYGVGVNDVPIRWIGNSKPQFYRAWCGMLERCYSPQYLDLYPTYRDCHVDPRWLNLSCFKAWMDDQEYEGMVLDKDLLVPGNRIYSPETCLFVPAWVNSLLANLSSKKRTLPMGVGLCGKRFKATYKSFGKTAFIGAFDGPEEAHAAYRAHRLGEIEARVSKYCSSSDASQVISAALIRLHEREFNQVSQLPTVEKRLRRQS